MDAVGNIQKLIETHRFADAWHQCNELLGHDPDNVELNFLAGQIHYMVRRLDIAEHFLNKVISLKPQSVDAYHLLSVVLDQTGQKENALRAARAAHSLAPDHVGICLNLGALLTGTSNYNNAEPFLLRAIELDGRHGVMFDNLGNLYRKQLRHEESLAAYTQAVELEPGNIAFRVHAIKAIDCCPGSDPQEAYAFARATGDKLQEQFAIPFQHYKKSKHKIRIGYLGSTLRRHSVTYFLLPVLENHSDKISVYSYNLGKKEDDTTERIRSLSECYRYLYGVRVDEVARRIYEDEINILIDLDGYTESGTLQILAQKPAPVQITWIGCPGTTGMSRVDYRIVDHFTDPADGLADEIHAERLIRMPDCFSVYSPPENSPDVVETPARKNGHITFGSFNVPTKMNEDLIGVWATVLSAVPGSVLTLKTTMFEQASLGDNVIAAFANHRITADRLRFGGFDASIEDHFRRYHEIDIALDSFPYNGTTTSCDAMWMGVPVISLAGDRHISRVGVSLLNNIGHPELVARDREEYVSIAKTLADDIEKLNAMRLMLRSKMSGSPLMNGAKLTEQLESHLGGIWHEHSESCCE